VRVYSGANSPSRPFKCPVFCEWSDLDKVVEAVMEALHGLGEICHAVCEKCAEELCVVLYRREGLRGARMFIITLLGIQYGAHRGDKSREKSQVSHPRGDHLSNRKRTECGSRNSRHQLPEPEPEKLTLCQDMVCLCSIGGVLLDARTLAVVGGIYHGAKVSVWEKDYKRLDVCFVGTFNCAVDTLEGSASETFCSQVLSAFPIMCGVVAVTLTHMPLLRQDL